MRLHNVKYCGRLSPIWKPKNVIEIEQGDLSVVVDRICTQCRYPLLGLRLLLHVITGMNSDGLIHISARHLAKKLDVNYDTVSKCLKDLREMEVLQIER